MDFFPLKTTIFAFYVVVVVTVVALDTFFSRWQTLFELVRTLSTQRKMIFIVQIIIIVVLIQLTASAISRPASRPADKLSKQPKFIFFARHSFIAFFLSSFYNNIPFYIAAHYHLFFYISRRNFFLSKLRNEKKLMYVFESLLYYLLCFCLCMFISVSHLIFSILQSLSLLFVT